MERLTNKREADAQREEYERRLANGYPRNIPEERFLRLAAFEDTGLMPAEVSALVKDWNDLCTIVGECGGIDRLRELAEADKDGRLVVLPCKVGGTVYRLQYIEQTPWRFVMGVAEIKFALIWLEEFGKTVFLTREEAEKALEEAKRDG